MKRICQSCGQPITRRGDFGTNTGGAISRQYCRYCFHDGNFTEDLSLEDMSERICGQAPHSQTNKDNYLLVERHISTLKRWDHS